jgi:hypothetical protein
MSAMNRNRAKVQLRPYEVKVSEDLRRETRPDRSFYGQCYQRALGFVLSLSASDEPVLVHGTLYAGHYQHAWVELPGEIVFDGVTQRFYSLRAYYAFLRASGNKKYSREKAAGLLLRHNHPGPW